MKSITIFFKKNYKYLFYNFATIIFYIGLSLIFVFVLIFLIISLIKGKLDYISFFFHNLKGHIILAIMTSLHVFMLASGILLIFISFFRMSPIFAVYKNRFEIYEFLQKTKVVNFNIIKSINVSINLVKEKFFTKRKKECRILINNPEFNFYLCYEVKGYFDDLIIEKYENNFSLRKCFTTREIVKDILNNISSQSNIKIPFLPE